MNTILMRTCSSLISLTRSPSDIKNHSPLPIAKKFFHQQRHYRKEAPLIKKFLFWVNGPKALNLDELKNAPQQLRRDILTELEDGRVFKAVKYQTNLAKILYYAHQKSRHETLQGDLDFTIQDLSYRAFLEIIPCNERYFCQEQFYQSAVTHFVNKNYDQALKLLKIAFVYHHSTIDGMALHQYLARTYMAIAGQPCLNPEQMTEKAVQHFERIKILKNEWPDIEKVNLENDLGICKVFLALWSSTIERMNGKKYEFFLNQARAHFVQALSLCPTPSSSASYIQQHLKMLDTFLLGANYGNFLRNLDFSRAITDILYIFPAIKNEILAEQSYEETELLPKLIYESGHMKIIHMNITTEKVRPLNKEVLRNIRKMNNC